MLGAIVGDIIGSQFEHANHLSKTFDLFTPNCFYSDDTVLTLAVCQALLNTDGQVDHLAAAADKHLAGFANTYWKLSYGSQFNRWRIAEVRTPYFSCGNGSAMRVSGCGFAGHTLDEVLALADAVTAVTHNHPEGLNGAVSGADCMARVRTDSIFQAASRTRIQTRESECRSPAVSTHGKIQSITKRSGAREVNSVRVTARAFCLTETSVTCALTAMRSSSAGSDGWFV